MASAKKLAGMQKMKHTLIISFDLIRQGELNQSFAIGSLLAFAKQDKTYGEDFIIHNISINSFDTPINFESDLFEKYFKSFNFSEIDTVAISAYIWNEHLINPLIQFLRQIGFQNKIVLGGYQITYGETAKLQREYPDCDIFVSGYAELGLLEAIKSRKPSQKLFINKNVDFAQLPSAYLTNELTIPIHQSMVRMETKRGCPYRCTFCAHRDLTNNKVHMLHLDKVFQELQLFRSKEVKKVNVLDPVFNAGNHYLQVLKEIDRLHFNETVFTFQTRFELIKGNNGEQFISLAEKTRSHLEFGIQTVIPEEYEIVNRPNKPDHIAKLFNDLNHRGISYEVSLIYGLPNQTVDSFKKSIGFLRSNGCTKMTAYPLMLLKGTELYHQKNKWQMKEEPLGEFDIPVVTSSSTFDRDDWYRMGEIANTLATNDRI
ncbi:MAG: B12-binding domain-containing radical SAM protein [Bacteroidia bacterium]